MDCQLTKAQRAKHGFPDFLQLIRVRVRVNIAALALRIAANSKRRKSAVPDGGQHVAFRPLATTRPGLGQGTSEYQLAVIVLRLFRGGRAERHDGAQPVASPKAPALSAAPGPTPPPVRRGRRWLLACAGILVAALAGLGWYLPRALPSLRSLSGAETTDKLQINGRGGNDKANVARHVSTIIGVDVNLGSAN